MKTVMIAAKARMRVPVVFLAGVCSGALLLYWFRAERQESVLTFLNQTNAAPCQISLTKEAQGLVRISIVNRAAPCLVIQKYAELRGTMRFEVPGVDGKWRTLSDLSPFGNFDPMEPVETDWTILGNGDGLSWDLELNQTGRLDRGDRVRVIWGKAKERVPKGLSTLFPQFPSSVTTTVLTVQ